MKNYTLAITPSHQVAVHTVEGEGPKWLLDLAPAFESGVASGMLEMALLPPETPFGPEFQFWHQFGHRLLAGIAKTPEAQGPHGFSAIGNIPAPPADVIQSLLMAAPFCLGIEYLNVDTLRGLWSAMAKALAARLAREGISFADFMETHRTGQSSVGRVFFHLAENKQDPAKPFAFMATYTEKMVEKRPEHIPLGEALSAYAGADRRDELLRLLRPVERAAAMSPWVKALSDSGRLYQPFPFTPAEAREFLDQAAALEASGIRVRVPDWWRQSARPQPRVVVTLGRPKSSLGLDGLLDFEVGLEVPGLGNLTAADIKTLLKAGAGLVRLKGQWVEVDPGRIREALTQLEKAKQLAREGISYAEGMRLLAGVSGHAALISEVGGDGLPFEGRITATGELSTLLENLRAPGGEMEAKLDRILAREVKATLRPYQRAGVKWLWLLDQLGLGGCLADDMGLGKTLQVLCLLTLQKHLASPPGPSLLVAPASLIGNWLSERDRFTPGLSVDVWHPAWGEGVATKKKGSEPDLILTTYGMAGRLEKVRDVKWHTVILDEAQAVKNAGSRQSRAVRDLRSRTRFALTGTPVENSLSDLWSIFDFCSPGLLGNLETFKKLVKRMGEGETADLAPLRRLLQPYLLRRLKTDKSIIQDLPDKTEVKVSAGLSRAQTALYAQVVEALAAGLKTAENMQRRGLVLATLLRLKQICNHPAQYKGHGKWAPAESGKFERLAELAKQISEKQEKVLVFTQFAEMVGPLSSLLESSFGRGGITLQGSTAIASRKKLVEAFQQADGPPFFVLSLKAGGTGLNLTAANHVVHFDRWWNPAVENQATDRAFRIGQKKAVLVHKFVVSGTLEEKVDALIESKKALSNAVLAKGDEMAFTEMSNAEIMKLVSLDAKRVLSEGEG